jgi:hypothetical protein
VVSVTDSYCRILDFLDRIIIIIIIIITSLFFDAKQTFALQKATLGNN